jgi:hypothetical protein
MPDIKISQLVSGLSIISAAQLLPPPPKKNCNPNPNLHYKKNSVNKNQGWEPIQQKYKANENTSRHNPKKNNQQKSSKDPMQSVLMATK